MRLKALCAEPWPEGVGTRVFETLDSTNAEAMRLAPALPGPCWILALRQTAGRGRRGRAWTDPEGNFAATLVLRPEDPPAALALRSFVAALALRDALISACGRDAGFTLKWPNDVLLHDRKLAGILLECTSLGGALYLAVGIGVNLRHAPHPEPEALAPVDLLSATGVVLDPRTLLDHLAPAFARWEARLATEGFRPLRAAFLESAARLGAPIVARTMHATHQGVFAGLDDTGALILDSVDGRVVLPAADVFFEGEVRPC